MPSYQLLVKRTRDRPQIPFALLLQKQGQEHHLEEQVAELVGELLGVGAQRGVGDLVGLLDRVRDDRDGRLLPVPGTVASQAAGQLVEVEQRLRELFVIPRRNQTES